MKKIALCGPSGVGKGYVSQAIISFYGFPVLDTDLTVHDMYENDKDLISELSCIFGNDIVKDGKIHRPTLRNIVFSNRAALDTLNHTVHQRVKFKTMDWFNEMEKAGYKAAFVDIPQIIESGMADEFDLVIGVTAPREVRIQRIVQRDKISLADAEKRINNQLSDKEYKAVCHYTIVNDGGNIIDALDGIFKEVELIEKT